MVLESFSSSSELSSTSLNNCEVNSFNPDKRIDISHEKTEDVSHDGFNPDKRIEPDSVTSQEVSGNETLKDSELSVNSETIVEKPNNSELSDADRDIIKKETNWSDKIIDAIKNIAQYDIYKDADLVETEINGRPCLVKKDLDLDYVSPKTIDDAHPNGLSNRELMEDGKSPYDSKTDERIELHHMGQEYDSPLAELCENSEHGDGKHGTLHDGDKPSWRQDPKLKNQYNNVDKPNHWIERSNS